ELSHASLIALDDRARVESLYEQIDPHLLERFHSLRKGLNDQAIVVAIHDQRWKQIAFTIDEAVSRRVANHRRAQLLRRVQSRKPKFAVDFSVVKRNHAQRDLR